MNKTGKAVSPKCNTTEPRQLCCRMRHLLPQAMTQQEYLLLSVWPRHLAKFCLPSRTAALAGPAGAVWLLAKLEQDHGAEHRPGWSLRHV